MKEPVFIAPTEEIELAIVRYGTDVLELPFGEFWYKWFDSNSESNHTIHIECNEGGLADKIRKTLKTLHSIKITKFFEVREVPLPDWHEYGFQYYIHFKKVNL